MRMRIDADLEADAAAADDEKMVIIAWLNEHCWSFHEGEGRKMMSPVNAGATAHGDVRSRV
jgi:hypothetical protein